MAAPERQRQQHDDPPPPPPPILSSRLPPTFRSDAEVLAQHHKFIRTVEDDAALSAADLRLARRYYDRLFKEYAIADLSLALRRRDEERQLAREAVAEQQGEAGARRRLADLRGKPPPQIGLRWRTRAEVVSGRGHLSCGGRSCAERAALSTFELPFRWRELGETAPRAALVKVRLCPRCAALLPRGGGGGGGGRARGGRQDRKEEKVTNEKEDEEEEQRAAGARRRPARSRSRSPPPAATAAAAAAAPAPPPPPRAAPAEPPPEDDDARLDRLVQDMIDAFEAGAG